MLDFWGKNQSSLVAVEESAVASRYAKEVVTLTAISTVANTYFQILGAQDRLRILHKDVEDSSRILDLIMQQFSAGTVSQINVAQQQSVVASLRASIPPVEETLQQSRSALAVLVGRAPERTFARGGSMMQVVVPRVTPGLPSELLNQRPDLRQAEAQLSASNYNVKAARAAFFPNIALTAQTGYQSAALKTLFGPGAWFYTAAASLTQPMFDGFLLEGQLELQLGLRQQFLQAYRRDVLSAFSDVEKALVALEQTGLQEKYQREAVLASQMAFYLSEQQLREGTVNLVTLLQTEQTLFQAEDQLVQVQLSRLLAAVSLFQALGGGWSPAENVASAAPAPNEALTRHFHDLVAAEFRPHPERSRSVARIARRMAASRTAHPSFEAHRFREAPQDEAQSMRGFAGRPTSASPAIARCAPAPAWGRRRPA